MWRAGTMVLLSGLVPPGSGWNFTSTVAINASGQILAGERVGPGLSDIRYALLTPVP